MGEGGQVQELPAAGTSDTALLGAMPRLLHHPELGRWCDRNIVARPSTRLRTPSSIPSSSTGAARAWPPLSRPGCRERAQATSPRTLRGRSRSAEQLGGEAYQPAEGEILALVWRPSHAVAAEETPIAGDHRAEAPCRSPTSSGRSMIQVRRHPRAPPARGVRHGAGQLIDACPPPHPGVALKRATS